MAHGAPRIPVVMHRTGPRFALVVGDTAGHTHPALAVADELERRFPGADTVFFGTADSIAARLVRDEGRPFLHVPGSPIRRASLAGLMRAGADSVRCFSSARHLLRDHRVDLALSFGSFVTGGVMLAARSLGLPTAILEANVEFGLANRWLRPWVDRVFRGLDSPDGRGIGMPLRSTHTPAGHPSRADPDSGRIRVLVASGTRGEGFFARQVPVLCERLVARGLVVEVWQQTTQAADLGTGYAARGIAARVETFISDMGAAYAWADVVIARAGASTVAELALASRPALLVPLGDASANHQHANARLWESSGAGRCVPESEWQHDRVADWLAFITHDPQARAAAITGARALARPTAAADIVTACLGMLEARR